MVATKTLYIPQLGDTFKLAEDWKITVYNDRRNNLLLYYMGRVVKGYRPLGDVVTQAKPGETWWEHRLRDEASTRSLCTHATINHGLTLKIDRIYIRRNAEEFNSITFTIPELKVRRYGDRGGPLTVVRFFASLDDVNRMVVCA